MTAEQKTDAVEPAAERLSGPAPRKFENRRRRADVWRRTLNILAYGVYPLLLVNLIIVMGLASQKQRAKMDQKLEQMVQPMMDPLAGLLGPQEPASSSLSTAQGVSVWIQVHAFLPIMGAGILLGMIGIVLDRKRSRRRTDSSLMGPLVLLILSTAGVLLYLVIQSRTG